VHDVTQQAAARAKRRLRRGELLAAVAAQVINHGRGQEALLGGVEVAVREAGRNRVGDKAAFVHEHAPGLPARARQRRAQLGRRRPDRELGRPAGGRVDIEGLQVTVPGAAEELRLVGTRAHLEPGGVGGERGARATHFLGNVGEGAAQAGDHLLGFAGDVEIGGARVGGREQLARVPPLVRQRGRPRVRVISVRHVEAAVLGREPVLVAVARLEHLVLAHVHPVGGGGLHAGLVRTHVHRMGVIGEAGDVRRVLAAGERRVDGDAFQLRDLGDGVRHVDPGVGGHVPAARPARHRCRRCCPVRFLSRWV